MKWKVCGLKFTENIKDVVALQPDFIGFIFFSDSKRFVGENFQMPSINKKIKKVGVFVNSNLAFIINKVEKYNLDFIQLHGDESSTFCEELKQTLSITINTKKIGIIKAFGIDINFDFNKLLIYSKLCEYFLFDTQSLNFGGTGEKFDWSLLKNYKLNVPFFISGGIGLSNIDEISTLKLYFPHLFAIDVNSKLEKEPGVKNIDELKKIPKSILEL